MGLRWLNAHVISAVAPRTKFGTNIRATAATTVPNFVRGAVVPLTLAFNYLKPTLGIVASAAVISYACVLIALWAARGLEETHGKSLDYTEPN